MAEKKTKKLIRMGELVKKTGVQKETIQFYINKGLLPRPVKTGRNMAYYDETYVERIRLIKELQLKRFLPLKVIKEIISDQASGNLSASELDALRFSSDGLIRLEELRHVYEPQTLALLSERTDLPPEEIVEMERSEMVSSTRNKQGERVYFDNDIRIVEAFAEIRKGGLTKEAGFDVSEFRLQTDIINMLAVEEVKVFARKFAGQVSNKGKELLSEIAENAIESINHFICHVRRKKILEAVKAFSAEGENALNQGEK
jgi:DNA-binding transcriptional MerR regulator